MVQQGSKVWKYLAERLIRNNKLFEPDSEFILLTPGDPLRPTTWVCCVLGAVRLTARKSWQKRKLVLSLGDIKGVEV